MAVVCARIWRHPPLLPISSAYLQNLTQESYEIAVGKIKNFKSTQGNQEFCNSFGKIIMYLTMFLSAGIF